MFKAFIAFFCSFFIFFPSQSKSATFNHTKDGMVVSDQKLASEVGANMLRAGGNAIDAAVAMGYALAVVNPCCGNIGGGGFMTIHFANGKNTVINFREKAPLLANSHMYLDKNGQLIENSSLQGYLAVAVPGTVLGFDTVLQKYGKMTRQQVMTPAIKLAEEGFIITPYLSNQFTKASNEFSHQPNIAVIFLKNGKAYQAGERLIQKDLAATLKLIAAQGSNVFYQGIIAKKIVAASKKNGGILTMEDFNQYTIQELKPITCTYRGYTIVSPPPPQLRRRCTL